MLIHTTVGSGAFKDVYCGRWGRVKVAISDLRGHLTRDDVKELALLRDFRHDNIVKFLGVCVPEDRSKMTLLAPLIRSELTF